MGFFKNLQERLFTLNVDDKSQQQLGRQQFLTSKPSQPSQAATKKMRIKAIKAEAKQVHHNLKHQQKIDKYVVGLKKSGFSFAQKIKEIQARHNDIDEDFFEELTEVLIMADISVSLVTEIMVEIKKDIRIDNISDPQLIAEIIADKMFIAYANRSTIDTRLNVDNAGLNVILVVGVNGSGKTTSIAKLAHLLKQKNKKVLIAAADTFRAGAAAQLAIWAQRLAVDIVMPLKEGIDPASVVYDAIKKAQGGKYDILIIDTAGRLQNKVNLMNELGKINQIIQRQVPHAPHEALLVLDATTGQNGVSQAQHFQAVTPLSGIVLTKLDGTSKGGIVLTIKDQLDLAVKLIGLGEQVDDLYEFDLDAFIYGMTKDLMAKR